VKHARSLRRRGQRGAAAVEFALVSLVLFPILLGMIDYGLWFNDSISARQGVREAARRAVVKCAPTCGTALTGMTAVKDLTRSEISSISGPTYVEVKAPNGWGKGKPLLVCAMVNVNGATGFVPMPNGRLITAKTQMSIEVDDTTMPTTSTTWADTPPAGASWSPWCA
jgi:Flp pilus assembly protein TadG